jgi:hypothetical protein
MRKGIFGIAWKAGVSVAVLLAGSQAVSAEALQQQLFQYLSNGEYTPGGVYEKYTIQVINPANIATNCWFLIFGEDRPEMYRNITFTVPGNGGTYSFGSAGRDMPYSASFGVLGCGVPVYAHSNYEIFGGDDQLVSFTSLPGTVPAMVVQHFWPTVPALLWVNVGYGFVGPHPTLFDVTLDDGSHASTVLQIDGEWHKFGGFVENVVSIPKGRRPISLTITSILGVKTINPLIFPNGDGQHMFASGAMNGMWSPTMGYAYLNNPSAKLQ